MEDEIKGYRRLTFEEAKKLALLNRVFVDSCLGMIEVQIIEKEVGDLMRAHFSFAALKKTRCRFIKMRGEKKKINDPPYEYNGCTHCTPDHVPFFEKIGWMSRGLGH